MASIVPPDAGTVASALSSALEPTMITSFGAQSMPVPALCATSEIITEGPPSTGVLRS
jgi:hypothetical protein